MIRAVLALVLMKALREMLDEAGLQVEWDRFI